MNHNIVKLYLIRLLFWMHFFSAVLIPFYTKWGGINLTQVFLLNSWFMFCSFWMEVPTGTIADLLGRKVSLAIGSLVAMVAALIYVSQPNFLVFMIAEFFFAIAFTLHSGADEALAYDTLIQHEATDTSKKILARMESFKLAGIIVGAIVGGFIASQWGLEKPMLFYIIPTASACLIALTLKETKVNQRAVTCKKSYLTILKEGGGYFLKSRVLLILTIELALSNALIMSIIWLYQPVMMRFGVPIKLFGIIHSLAALGQIVYLSSVDKLEKLMGSKLKLLVFSTIIAGIGLIIAGISSNIIVAIAAMLLTFTFGLPRAPIFSSYMNKYIPSDQRATILSITAMARTICIVIFNPLIGFFADRSLPFALLGLGTVLIILPIFSRIKEDHLVD